jgi:hypothetical protein
MPFGGLSGGQTLVQPTPAVTPTPSTTQGFAPQPTMQPPLSSVSVGFDTNQSYNGWIYFLLSGVQSPGTIARNGIKGFKRETGWDVKAGKGVRGATLTLKNMPPCEGSIVLQLVTAADFTAWDAFVSAVLAIPIESQQADGLSIFYPQFASIGLTTVVVKHFTGPEYQGKGLYHATIEIIEWSPPPNVSIVATVASTSPDQPDSDSSTPPPEDPRIVALQAQIAAASQAATP